MLYVSLVIVGLLPNTSLVGLLYLSLPIAILSFMFWQSGHKVSEDEMTRRKRLAEIIASKKKFTKKELHDLLFFFEAVKYLDKEQFDEEIIKLLDYDPCYILQPFLLGGDEETEDIYSDSQKMRRYLEKKLSREQMVAHILYQYVSECNNGGLEQWLSNSSGLMWEETLDALKEIGLDGEYKFLKEFIKRTLGDNSPKTRKEIAATVTHGNTPMEEGVVFRHGDVFKSIDMSDVNTSEFGKIESKLKAYIKKHISQFTIKRAIG